MSLKRLRKRRISRLVRTRVWRIGSLTSILLRLRSTFAGRKPASLCMRKSSLMKKVSWFLLKGILKAFPRSRPRRRLLDGPRSPSRAAVGRSSRPLTGFRARLFLRLLGGVVGNAVHSPGELKAR
ncbi:MAG: hypothetical protein [Microviridae sp. ctQch27]|nr:MAG: hypothetical protein [Microviridae sp. ctQch27]